MGEETAGYRQDAGRETEPVVYTGPILCYNSKINQNENDDMSKQQDIELATAAQAGDKHARAELLNKYERLCHKLARKFGFTATNHDHEDLVQEGRIGLLKAIDTYDESHGAAFMTWAYYHVRGSIASAGRIDRKQPKYPLSIEDCPRAYNVEDPTQAIEPTQDLPPGTIFKIIEECCGGFHTKRAQIVMDRFGLFGKPELRNQECAEKYGMTKYAVTSHTSQFKKRVRDRYPQFADFV